MPLIIIASRNQIEMKEKGSGYVNNLSTQDFMVDLKDEANIIVGRDHGGPFQSQIDQANCLSTEEAIASSIESFKTDIDCGVTFLHIDPSKYSIQSTNIDGMIEVLVHIYGELDEYAKIKEKNVFFEIGSEGHGPEVDDKEELHYFLDKVTERLKRDNLDYPLFCVAKLGSYVLEDQNIGTFNDRILKQDTKKIEEIVSLIHSYKLRLKQHNADYLSPEVLSQIPKLKIDSINIAPQLGLIESEMIIQQLKTNNLNEILGEFFSLVDQSNSWKKWTNSEEPNLELKARLGGHYVFSQQKFIRLKKRILEVVPDLDSIIQSSLSSYLLDTMKNLNYWRA